MPRILLTLHDDHAEETTKTSPELSKKDAEQQEAFVRANIMPRKLVEAHPTDPDAVIRTEFKGNATGTPGEVLELTDSDGQVWLTVLNSVIDNVEIID